MPSAAILRGIHLPFTWRLLSVRYRTMLIQTPLKLLFLHFRHRHCTFSCHCFCSSFLSSLRALCLPIQFFAGTQREGEAPTGLVHLIVGGSIRLSSVSVLGMRLNTSQNSHSTLLATRCGPRSALASEVQAAGGGGQVAGEGREHRDVRRPAGRLRRSLSDRGAAQSGSSSQGEHACTCT